jgi:hypothetical protein
VKNGLFHSKFHFWTRAINRIYKNQKNNDFNSIAVPGPCTRGYLSNNSMSSPGHSRKSCRYDDRKSQKSKEITTLDLKKLKDGQKFKFFAIIFSLPWNKSLMAWH